MIKDFIKPVIFLLIVLIVFSSAIIINRKTDSPFYSSTDRIKFTVDEDTSELNDLSAEFDNVVIPVNSQVNAELFPDCYHVLLVNNDTKEIYAAKNVHRRMYPASMTKLMTGIIVCDKIEAGVIGLDDIVTLDKNYDLSGRGAGVSELTKGCQISVRNLLSGLLIQSNNYYALILADYVAGSEEAFCEMMNEKAYSIGATNTHFANPHGLDQMDHYSTSYDIYLIINEAAKHTIMNDIDSYAEYSYTYKNAAGYEIDTTITATNLFMGDNLNLPANFEILDWKTGTENGAGYCLTMRLTNGVNTFTLVASNSESKQQLYDDVIKLICLIK